MRRLLQVIVYTVFLCTTLLSASCSGGSVPDSADDTTPAADVLQAEDLTEISVDSGSEPPFPKIVIQLGWDEPDADLDIHIIRLPDPSTSVEMGLDLFGNPTEDCFYDNCKMANDSGTSDLDWGVVGDETDNPVLQEGENAGTESGTLYGIDGQYLLLVHYYKDEAGAIEVLPDMEIFLGPVLLNWIITKETLEENSIWVAAALRCQHGMCEVIQIDQIFPVPN